MRTILFGTKKLDSIDDFTAYFQGTAWNGLAFVDV